MICKESNLPARSQTEIIADAKYIAQAAEEEIKSAQRMKASIDAIAETAVNAGEAAVKQATAAGSAALAGHLDAAETQLKTARLSLATATRSAARAKMGADAGDPKEEWKECRVSIDRFDKLLVDLRKTGFGFITAIVSGAAFLLGPTTPVSTASTPSQAAVTSGSLVKLAIFGIIALLIVALFAIDRVHQIWPNTVVDRAKVLEGLLDYKLTRTLSGQLRRHDAVLIGIVLYIVLLAITGGIFVISLETLQAGYWVWNVYQYRVIGGTFLALLWIIMIGSFARFKGIIFWGGIIVPSLSLIIVWLWLEVGGFEILRRAISGIFA